MRATWPNHCESYDLQWIRTADPNLLPLTVADVKDHLRITQNEGNAGINAYIKAAAEAAEAYMNRGLLTQTWQLTLRWFADVMWLPMAAPLQNDALANPSTAPVIQYYDVNGALQTLATTYYNVDTVSRPGRITRASGQSWPSLEAGRLDGRVIITYVVGWTTPSDVPERIKQGMRIYIAGLDADRDGMDPNGERGRQAAEACWNDRVYNIEPMQTPYGYGYRSGYWLV